MPTWEVELIPEAQADFKKLEASVKKRVLKQLVKLEQNPRYGDPLGNKSRRGRNAGHPAPPAQIPACTTNALGSHLGYVTQRR